LWVIFALMDPDPDPYSNYGSGSGSNGPTEYGSNTDPDTDPDPDPKPWVVQCFHFIRNKQKYIYASIHPLHSQRLAKNIPLALLSKEISTPVPDRDMNPGYAATAVPWSYRTFQKLDLK
jgi:hypothetical protein